MSRELGAAGPTTGPDVEFRVSLLRHALRFIPLILLIAVLLLPRNRRPCATVLALPYLLVVFIGALLSWLPTGSIGEVGETFGIVLSAPLYGLVMMLLLAFPVEKRSRLLTVPASLLGVVLFAAASAYLSRMSSDEVVGYVVSAAIGGGMLWLAAAAIGIACGTRFSAGRAFIGLAAGTALGTGLACVGLLAFLVQVGAATPDAAMQVFAAMAGAAVISFLYVFFVGAILVFVCSVNAFYRARLAAVFGSRAPGAAGAPTGEAGP